MKVTSAKGRVVDMSALKEQQGTTIAAGNARMNGRGDRLGKGGVVVKSQEDITKEYYANNPKAVASAPVSLKDISDEIVMTPRQAVEKLAEDQKAKSARRKTRDSED